MKKTKSDVIICHKCMFPMAEVESDQGKNLLMCVQCDKCIERPAVVKKPNPIGVFMKKFLHGFDSFMRFFWFESPLGFTFSVCTIPFLIVWASNQDGSIQKTWMVFYDREKAHQAEFVENLKHLSKVDGYPCNVFEVNSEQGYVKVFCRRGEINNANGKTKGFSIESIRMANQND